MQFPIAVPGDQGAVSVSVVLRLTPTLSAPKGEEGELRRVF
jgi:hypothetical protein